LKAQGRVGRIVVAILPLHQHEENMAKIIKLREKYRFVLSAAEFEALDMIIKAGFKDAKKSPEAYGSRGFKAFEDGLTITDDRSNDPKRAAPAGFGFPKKQSAA
jgi:hypothetical protein